MQVGYLNYVESSSELQHHGIKGQSWGVQNGPPYPLNQRKHNQVLRKAGAAIKQSVKKHNDKVAARKQAKQEKKAADAERKQQSERNPRKMTDQQLTDNINRLRKEKEYKQLLAETRHAGRQKTQGILSRAGSRAVETVAIQAATYAARKMVSQFLADDNERARMFGANWVNPLQQKKDKDKD